MIEGVSQVIVEVDDQDRAVKFWIETMEFELAQDAPYGEVGRWVEVRTREKETSPRAPASAGRPLRLPPTRGAVSLTDHVEPG